ncbi:efflux RND transporter periplasmic adaptor subunit [Rhodohalobacter sp. 614A]|uniref:efflux RND transporter periplasmic adaptor subunit n=1 Tax=Rhodohalobacter sp. 614A TaxID=2908649 RepID=UPI001F2A3750|nr:efflux RND transporter periplasmic adaptor subunit [Rhodohalobacter sp. 614A]
MKTIKLLTIWIALCTGIFLGGCGSESEPNQIENQDGRAIHELPQQDIEEHSEADEEHTQEVHLTNQQLAGLNIVVDTLRSGSTRSVIERPATVTYDLDRIAKVGPRIEAKVVCVLKDLGEYVEEGEPIVQMSSVELGKIKADYIRLKAALKKEEAHYGREQNLYNQEISSQAELLQAELEYEQAQADLNAISEALRLYGLSEQSIENIKAGNETPLSYFYLSSPLSGTIQHRELSPGQTVTPDETPIHVADLSEVWVMIDAYEQDISFLETDQSIELTVRSIPKKSFEGTLNWISYGLEEETRTMPARAKVNNSNGELRAGMFGTVRIHTNREQKTTIIPVDAIQQMNGENHVFVPGDEEGSFRSVQVTLGNENAGYVEVLAGLAPGSEVVVAGAFDLKSALTAGSRSASHSH